MVAIYSICLLLLGLTLLLSNETNRICALIIGIICFNGAVLGPLTSQQLLSLCCFLSLVKEYKSFHRIRNLVHETDCSVFFYIMAVSFVFLCMNAPYRHGISGLFSLVFKEWICSYFYLFYGVLCIYNRSDIGYKKIVKTIILCLIILTVFGIINYVTRNSWFVNTFLINERLGISENMYVGRERFRVQSMFHSTFDYGYINILILLLLSYMRKISTLISKQWYYICVLCCLFGIITCNSRTVQMTFLLSGSIYVYMTYRTSKAITYGIIALFVFSLALTFIPSVGKYVDFVFSIFDTSTTASESSSLEMRDIQFATLMYYIKDNLWFGLGENYYYYNFWEQGAGFTDLLGLEGVHLKYLLERGIIGLFFYVLFYATLSFKLYKRKAEDNSTTGLALSVLVAYIVFSVMTGELSSLIPSLLIIGVSIGRLPQLKY